ncbi:MAG: hypothetical protein HY286_13710 [Planctomycetes bacterium]|nr:hypothetical protein [Planctomycetota bacterium]
MPKSKSFAPPGISRNARFLFFFILLISLSNAAGGCASNGSGNSFPREASVGDDFEFVQTGTAPGAWIQGETHGKGTPGVWRVIEVSDAPSGKKVLSLEESRNSGGTFNFMIFKTQFGADVRVSTRLLAWGGAEDRGGGVVWRFRDENNYCVVRWNPLENNVRGYRVEDGVRKMLASADVEANRDRWHSLEAAAGGNGVIIKFDGREILSYTDDAPPVAGKTGLWTKADATTSFDEFTVTTKLETATKK